MSWLTLALGLIREAAGTEMGQDIINDMRPGASSERPTQASDSGPAATDAWRRSVEDRFEVAGRNTEVLVQMLNSQNETLIRIQKRQRIWNLALTGAVAVAVATLIFIWFR